MGDTTAESRPPNPHVQDTPGQGVFPKASLSGWEQQWEGENGKVEAATPQTSVVDCHCVWESSELVTVVTNHGGNLMVHFLARHQGGYSLLCPQGLRL